MYFSGAGTAEFLGWMVNEKGIEPHVPVWDKGQRSDGTFSPAVRHKFSFVSLSINPRHVLSGISFRTEAGRSAEAAFQCGFDQCHSTSSRSGAF